MNKKKLLIFFIFIFVAVSLVGCGNNDSEEVEYEDEVDVEDVEDVEDEYSDEEKALLNEDLTNYIDEEMSEIIAYGDEIIISYAAMIEDDSLDNEEMHKRLMEEILPAMKELREAASNVQYQTEEVGFIHGLYEQAIEVREAAFAMLVVGLENDNVNDDLAEGKQGLAIAAEGMESFVQAMHLLGAECGVNFQ